MVCQMRRGPEDIPYSPALLLLVLVLNLALGVGMHWLSHPISLGVGASVVLMAIGMDALVLWLLLLFKRLELRFVQALTAIYGADFLLGMMGVPLVLAGQLLAGSPLLGVVVFGQMLLVGWNLGVRGFLYHRALDIGILQANMLSLTLFLLHVFLAAKLFPQLLAAPGH